MATKRKSKKTSTPQKKGAINDNSDLCFTIMPFGGWFDDYYSSIYCPAIEKAGLTPCRADDLYRPSTIVNDIWTYTQKAKIVLADLSGKNPNVFYELGLAHALAKPAILVVEKMDDVPFDLRALRVIEYDKNDPEWGELLSEKIENSIKEVLEAPTQAVLPAFLEIKDHKSKPSITENEKEMLQLRQEMDIVKREMYRYRNRNMHDKIRPTEAEELIRVFIERDLPKNMILRRLTDRGAPADWVENKILEIHKEKDNASVASKKKTIRKKRASTNK